MSHLVAFRLRSNESQTMTDRNKESLPKMQPPFRKMFPQSLLKGITLIDEQRIKDTMKHKPDVVKATKKLCLYIPFDILSTYCEPQTDLGLSCGSQCIFFSMFYNRVLPRPSALSAASIDKQQKPSRDSLLQNKIMTGGEANSTARDLHLQISSSPIRRHLRSFSDRGTLGDYEESVPPDSITGYNTRKRSTSQLSAKVIRTSSNHLPSISPISTPSRSTTTPSDICLCQPDPKVPRPRNGIYCSS